MKISKLFDIEVAKSSGIEDYDPGDVPFITNTTLNNGVVAYVDVFDSDRVFDGPAICISGLGYATVQYSKFLPKGNGGDSATILLPQKAMSDRELLYYATLFNFSHNWRFSFGRKASKHRLKDLELEPLFEVFQKNYNLNLNDFKINIIDKISTDNDLLK